ncbi:MAG: GIY-YIG nuclease family protein [Polaribacter sp.]
MEKYFVYIIFSEKIDRFYVGFTSDIPSRIEKHNQKHKGFTGRSNDWTLMYFEEFNTKKEALLRERKIKSWKSRKKIEQLISNSN